MLEFRNTDLASQISDFTFRLRDLEPWISTLESRISYFGSRISDLEPPNHQLYIHVSIDLGMFLPSGTTTRRAI